MRRIVSNTGPILHLHEIDQLDLLSQAGTIHIPKLVGDEVGRLVPDWAASRPGWIHVTQQTASVSGEITPWLEAGIIHTGEAAALGLAKGLSADWFLTDDAAARLLAQTMGLETHGTLGVLLWAAATERITAGEAHKLLDRLSRSSLWISPRILSEAHSTLDVLGQ